MTSEVISYLEDVLPEIKRTRDPEGSMLKFAQDRNLAPAMLEKLAQVYNSAKTINFLEKAANRGDSFHVVDADALLKRYTSTTPEKVATDFSEWIDRPQTKAASLTYKIADRFPRTSAHPEVLAEASISELPEKPASRALERREAEVSQINAQAYDQVLFDLAEDVHEKAAAVAETIRGTPEFDFAEFEGGALLLTGGTVKLAMDQVSSRLLRRHFTHKRASGPGDAAFSTAERNILVSVQKLQNAIDLQKAAKSIAGEFNKDAGVATAISSPGLEVQRQYETQAPSAGRQPTPRVPRSESADISSVKDVDSDSKKPEGGIAAMIRNVSIPKSPLHPVDMIRSLAMEAMPTRNVGQEQIDNDFSDTQTKVVLERLMHTDPILSEADPHVVLSLANSIRDQSPHLAKDINAMRFALREAVQYNSLPTHTVKDIAGIEKAKVETAGDVRALNKDKYQMGFKPKAKV
jgi:hypothetical protein